MDKIQALIWHPGDITLYVYNHDSVFLNFLPMSFWECLWNSQVDRKRHNFNGRSSIHARIIRFMREQKGEDNKKYIIFNLSWILVNGGFVFRVNYLDSERYLKMTCDCKLFFLTFFSLLFAMYLILRSFCTLSQTVITLI